MTQYYEIRLKGHLDESWAELFNTLSIHHTDGGETLLTGFLPDQSALHGVLNHLRDLGIQLISVNTSESEHNNTNEEGNNNSGYKKD